MAGHHCGSSIHDWNCIVVVIVLMMMKILDTNTNTITTATTTTTTNTINSIVMILWCEMISTSTDDTRWDERRVVGENWYYYDDEHEKSLVGLQEQPWAWEIPLSRAVAPLTHWYRGCDIAPPSPPLPRYDTLLYYTSKGALITRRCYMIRHDDVRWLLLDELEERRGRRTPTQLKAVLPLLLLLLALDTSWCWRCYYYYTMNEKIDTGVQHGRGGRIGSTTTTTTTTWWKKTWRKFMTWREE